MAETAKEKTDRQLIEQGPQAFPNPDNFTEPTRDGFYELHHVVR